MQHLDRPAPRRDDDSTSRPEDRRAHLRGGRLEPPDGGIRRRHRPEPDRPRPELAHDRRRPSDVIVVSVRDREEIDAQQSEGPERRRDDPGADVEFGSRQASGVDQH